MSRRATLDSSYNMKQVRNSRNLQMVNEFPLGTFQVPGKLDYLFKISVYAGNFPVGQTKKTFTIYIPTGISGNLWWMVNHHYIGLLNKCPLTKKYLECVTMAISKNKSSFPGSSLFWPLFFPIINASAFINLFYLFQCGVNFKITFLKSLVTVTINHLWKKDV